MWSQLVLCFFVGLAYASNNQGWKDNTEYVYQVRGRTLASLHEVADQYSGILLKAQLIIRPKSDGVLSAKISEVKYGQVHSQLPGGWNTFIPDSQLSYKDLSMSGKPFEIVMSNGVVRDLIVDKEVSNWEANIIKSIVSQFQLDTKAENLIPSHVNTLPEEQSNTGVFKTMEETVTGKTETLYDIHLLPEHVLESQPWLAPKPQLRGDGEFIEIVKSKNYSSSEQRPLYHYGLSGVDHWEPASNQMGQFFTRSSISRAVVTGKLHRYTVQNSYTVNKVIMSPTLNDKQKGSVISMLNVTLLEVRPQSNQPEGLASPVSLGSLVYRYNKPSSSNMARPMEYQQRQYNEDSSSSSSSSEERLQSPSQGRFRRNAEEQIKDNQYHSASSKSSAEEYWQVQEQPKITNAPESPLLPLTMGYKGNSIKKDSSFNVVHSVQKVAKEIGQELEQSEEILKQNTLNKYTILSTLARLCNHEELQQAAKQLYTQSEKGPERNAWVAFRDAVAETGTGPAFLTIQEWIQTQKIKNEEAAEIVAAMAYNVREPTTEYMRAFYALITKEEVVQQQYLNETALLSYTNLLRKVYVNKQQSHNQYPVHSYGIFRTQEGKSFMREEVIPYLTKQLNQAISRADTYKIHVYIRALGNVADRHILAAFEPYLEGTKQASHFQRLMMVVCMDKLAAVHPVLARSVLYKVYQNYGDAQEVRVAAVYQLIRTSPPTDMLQRMAQYTHIDTNEHVNAAVKSSIESAAELEGYEFQYLRSSARAAKPLLTPKIYGFQHGRNYLRSYVVDELKLTQKQSAQFIGSEDSFLPKGLRLSMRSYIGGLRRELINIQAMVSSIDDLTHVMQQQTESYKQAQQAKEQGQGGKWSSETIAQLLNMKSEEREQLEGSLNIELGGLQKLWSFDNQTFEHLPEVIRRYEEMIKSGKSFRYTKLVNMREIAISFPTEMGFPFLYTYDKPTLINIEGKFQAQATPQIARDNKLYKPDTVHGSVELHITLSGKTQGRLTFVTPFDHQQYVAGYDRVMHTHIPLHGKIQVDVKNMQVEAEFEPLEQGSPRLFHYSSWPYTSKTDIMNLQPISLRPTTQHIYKKSEQSYNRVFGQKETGMAFRIEMVKTPHFIDLFWFNQLLKQRDPISALMTMWDDAAIQHTKLSVYHAAEQSSARKFTIRLGAQHQYRTQYQDESNDSNSGNDLSKISQTPSESLSRQQDFIKKVAPGIHNAQVEAYDASIEFQGTKTIKYSITGAMAKSNVGPKSKVLVYYQKSSNSEESKPYQVAFSAKSYIPNTNGLDLSDSLKQEPVVKTQFQLSFGSNYESSSKIQAEAELRRSDERKQYLLEEPLYFQCKREMQQGNHQLPACANMTIRANLLDHAEIKVQYEQLTKEFQRVAREIYSAARFNFYPTLEVNSESRAEQNHFNVKARFYPNFDAVNVTVKTQEDESTFHNIRIGEWTKQAVAVHPVFHARTRFLGKSLALETYRPICVVDNTETNTFNNKTYPISLNNIWTVMLQYVPVQARQHGKQQQESVEQQLKRQIENYVVLVRASQDNQEQKEVKITLNVPETNGKLLEITLKPSSKNPSGYTGSNPSAKVEVDGQAIKYDDKESHDIKQGLVQIYALRNGEVKVEVRDVFYIIYDGSRVKLTALSGKFRDSIRGLCGQFNDDKSTDFLTSENCVARDVRDFIESYQVEEGKQRVHQLRGGNKQCYDRQVLYANVISDRDAGREQKRHEKMGHHSGMCTKYQTRYVEQNGEICFTIRPMPICKCQQRGSITKNVSVHCIQKTNVAQLWKAQIDKGASPDFSLKKESKTVQMELPQGCSK